MQIRISELPSSGLSCLVGTCVHTVRVCFLKTCLCLCIQVEAEREELAVFCGRENTDTELVPGERVITSPKNSLSVCFRSDFSDEEHFSGFQAHYSAVGEGPDIKYIHRI